jgi:hypothetical protein
MIKIIVKLHATLHIANHSINHANLAKLIVDHVVKNAQRKINQEIETMRTNVLQPAEIMVAGKLLIN